MVKQITPPTGGKLILPTSNVLAMRARDPWREATAKAREVATQRETIVHAINVMVADGVSQNNAVKLLLEKHAAGRLQLYVNSAMLAAAKKGGTAPTRSTLCSWCASYKAEGLPALLPDYKGRVVESAAWWGPALEYYNVAGSKPSMGAVFNRLYEVDGFNVTYDMVRNYLNSVPAMYGRNSPARIGKNLYRLTQKKYIERTVINALAGDVYVADGYCIDVYLQHPVSGRSTWRAELTVAMDLKSRVIVGWRIDENESTVAVQNMWAEAFDRHQHVPPFLYIDNGSGYKNKLMKDELIGFYARAGIQQIIHSRPSNPHGKGWIEQFFRIMKDDFLKLWQPRFYCGDDMADEVKQATYRECDAGRLQAPTLAQFTDAFTAWLQRYENRAHPEDKTVTRVQLWRQLVPIAPHASVTEMKYQAVELMVRRATVTQANRRYGHPDLLAFNGQKIVLEYDLMKNETAIIRTLDGRWICDAHLLLKIDAVATNRLEEKRLKALNMAIKRDEKRTDEKKARAGRVFDAEALTDYLTIDGEATVVSDTPFLLDLNDI